jgi:hypothetical protein
MVLFRGLASKGLGEQTAKPHLGQKRQSSERWGNAAASLRDWTPDRLGFGWRGLSCS